MRVVSGRFRGRTLGRVPAGVRPTSDRVRESLFAALEPLDGLRVLDLFAGTGALGIEAVSRGASGVVFVERSRRVAKLLLERLAGLGLEDDPSVEVMVRPAEAAIRALEARSGALPFDLLLLDPPYAAAERETVLERLAGSSIVAPDATVVVEGPTRHPLPPVPGWRVCREQRYGETLLSWLEVAGRRDTEGGMHG